MASTQPELPLMSGDARGRIFTIPPSEPFLDALARAVLSGDLPRAGGRPPGPLDLADTQIYLPNRAACRALADAFLAASPSGATLLPRIRPLGSAEEDSLLILYGGDDVDGRPDLPVAPAIGALDRRMALTQLVLAWARRLNPQMAGEAGLRIADTPAAAAELALELMRLMDEAETEGVDLGRLRELVPERFAGHEQLSLSFLDIVLQIWPAHLAEHGLINPVDRRNRIMLLETQRLREITGDTPVIVAGSTGSMPATADLMKAVIGLPNGAIVLPGVDLLLDETGWAAVPEHPEHPQAGLHALLGELGAVRGDVAYLAGAEPRQDGMQRAQFLTEAMRPAATLGVWPQFAERAKPEAIRASLEAVSLIEAATEQEEAAAIALILREAMDVPGKTASLVTPDRTLARRITAELGRWGLALDATGGEMLRTTPAGVFYDLIAEAAATGSQIPLLALLKHPLTRLGLPERDAHATARIVEIAAMRQAWCGEGLDGLSKSLDLAKKKKPRHAVLDRLSEEEWAAAADLVSRLKRAFLPLTRLGRAKPSPFAALAAAHAEATAALTADETGDSASLRISLDAQAMAVFMAALCGDVPGPAIALADYPALFRSLIRLEKMPGGAPAYPRLKILGAMEARLTSADLLVIAGMNEGVWPEAADPGPWLNRSMREALGLPTPERRTRLAAHDVCQLMGAPEVVLTRALKSGGAPTVPSRWLMRIEALLQGVGAADALAPAGPWLQWAAARNEAPTIPPAKPPAPCPPLDARPRRLSVSEIETLIANPYAIYAKRVLGLAPLNPLDAEPGGSQRGQIIHDMLHRFARRHSDTLPADCAGELLALFDDCAALYGDRARIRAFWRPRLERFAEWFAETEAERRGPAAVFSELRGKFEFETDGGPFTLHARADRIDLAPDGGLAIYDYKSGSMPTDSAAADFKAPQLPLEALIAIEGRFDGIASHSVTKLAYISAKGGEPAGLERALVKLPPDELARGARDGLFALIARFDRLDTPYAAMRRAAFTDAYRYDDYAHLARVAEWAGTQEEV